jgi:Peptidase_C39 like family
MFFKVNFSIVLLAMVFSSSVHADIYHHDLNPCDQQDNIFLWENEVPSPFDEMIVSWNASRPVYGCYLIDVSVKIKEWSSWLPYAEWGGDYQKSFDKTCEHPPFQTYQDIVTLLNGEKATGFRIRITAKEGAALQDFRTLHICLRDRSSAASCLIFLPEHSLRLEVPGISQIALAHPRNYSICSPTSMAAVVQYLRGNKIEPSVFADLVWDTGFDIFGNWVFNVAQASVELGNTWWCWVERLSGFAGIYENLKLGIPSVVSIQGPLPGSALPYLKGHLIVVCGFDAVTSEVLCMDPAFPSDEQTLVRYGFEDFLQAWNRRGRVAYLCLQVQK